MKTSREKSNKVCVEEKEARGEFERDEHVQQSRAVKTSSSNREATTAQKSLGNSSNTSTTHGSPVSPSNRGRTCNMLFLIARKDGKSLRYEFL